MSSLVPGLAREIVSEALPGVLGAIYFQGFGEKGHLFSGIWGESITFWVFREQGAVEKHFRELGRKVIFLSGSREQRPPPPLWGGALSVYSATPVRIYHFLYYMQIVHFEILSK